MHIVLDTYYTQSVYTYITHPLHTCGFHTYITPHTCIFRTYRLNTGILNQVNLEGGEPRVLEGAQLRSWELCDSGLASHTLVCLVFKTGMTVPASQGVGTAG